MCVIKKLFFMSIAIIVVGNQLYAKVRAIGSKREFEHFIAQQGICVVLFYEAGTKNDRDLREKNKQLQYMVDDVSKQPSYDNADVLFIKVNCVQKEFTIIMDQYGITQVPCFILFYNGQHITNEQGNSLLLTGFITRNELESFINHYYGQEIKLLDEKKIALKKQRIDEEKSSWLPYFYPRDIFVRDYDPAQRSME